MVDEVEVEKKSSAVLLANINSLSFCSQQILARVSPNRVSDAELCVTVVEVF